MADTPITPTPEHRRRALSSERARWVRQSGHNDAQEFAIALGLTHGYENDLQAKKDVIDPAGDSYSVKSGEKKWQIFLYSRGRFERDDAFRVMNGMGDLLIACIDSFPPTYAEYQADKLASKKRLQKHMRALSEKLQDKIRRRAFFNKSMFNGGEVNYLAVKQDGIFHVFTSADVVNVLGDETTVCNSQSRSAGQVAEQKVLFRYKGVNLAELEMRNDSEVHYAEIRFNMVKPKAVALLFEKVSITGKYGDKIILHGNASKKFGRWKR